MEEVTILRESEMFDMELGAAIFGLRCMPEQLLDGLDLKVAEKCDCA